MMSVRAKKHIVTVVSLVMFVGPLGFSMMSLLNSSEKHAPVNTPPAEAISEKARLQQEERGYQLVLTREPNNSAALEGLLNTRVAMNNPKSAQEPLEKLIKLNPERADYKTLLAKLKQQAKGS